MAEFRALERPAHAAAELPVAPPTRLIGRESVLTQIYPYLKESRAVFVHGDPGVGKTALGATLAAAIAQPPGESLFLTVGPHTTLESLLVRIGRAYDEPEIAQAEEPLGTVAAVAELLQRRKPLIVLDGALDPHVAAKFVTRCADRVPVLLLDQTAQAGPWVQVTLDPLAPDHALALFKQEANIPNSALEHDTDVRTICKALSYVPFALCVVARSMLANKTQPAQTANNLRQLTTLKDDPARLALTVTFAGLQNAVQGIVFMLAALPSGGGSVEVLQRMTGAAPDAIKQALTMLSRLRLGELSTHGDVVSFKLHALVQRFAEDRLHTLNRLDGLRTKAQEALLAQAHAYTSSVDFDQIAVEMDNFLMLARDAQRRGEREIGTTLASTLTRAGGFIGERGFGYEMTQLRGPSASSAFPAYIAPHSADDDQDDDDFDDEDEDYDQDDAVVAEADTNLDESADDYDDDDDSGAIAAPASLFSSLASEPTIEEFDAATLDASARGDSSPESVLSSLLDDGQDDQAFDDDDLLDDSAEIEVAAPPEPQTIEEKIAHLRQVLAQARQDADDSKAASTLRQLGVLEVEQGMLIEAITTYNQALTVYENNGNQRGQLETLELLSALMEKTENAQAAIVMATRGSKLAAVMGDEETQLQLLNTLGDARQQLGESTEAVTAYNQALEIARRTDDRQHEAVTLYKLGFAMLDTGDPERAVDMWEQALAMFKVQARRDYEGRTKGALGSAYAELQRWNEAVSFHKSALFIARDLGDQREESVQLNNLGYVSVQAGDLASAMLHYRQALHLAYKTGDKADIAVTLVDLARLLLRSPAHLLITQLLVEDGLRVDPMDKDLRLLRDRVSADIASAQARGVNFKPAVGSAQDFAANAYALLSGS